MQSPGKALDVALARDETVETFTLRSQVEDGGTGGGAGGGDSCELKVLDVGRCRVSESGLNCSSPVQAMVATRATVSAREALVLEEPSMGIRFPIFGLRQSGTPGGRSQLASGSHDDAPPHRGGNERIVEAGV
jgi:hypothetical protein